MSVDREGVEDFFADLEAKVGAPIRVYSLARCLSGCVEARQPIWGLFFVTERALYFHYHVQGRSLVGLILGRAPDEERMLSIPLDAIAEVRRPPRPPFLRRVLVLTLPSLIVVYTDTQGARKQVQIELEPSPKQSIGVEQFEQAIANPKG